uniref:EF-hand domain-containing protein n=1 Tax=Tanacetum cinerariifolium TaxID=118510 RepID=A0A6L2KHR9_TANCI|nr:hypothetical protein [Tanacetum cinerariifolium]
MADAKKMWEAIKSRFGGNDKSKKMQKYLLKQQFEARDNGSDNEVKSCSKTCEESYARLKKLYDEQRDKLNDASVEITAYTLALKRLLNTQMSDNDKFGLGYGDYRYGSILSYENEVLQSMFMNKESDLENTSVNDRYAAGMHAIPHPMTGNYMPSRPDVEINYSKFTYGPKQPSANDLDFKTSDYASCKSDSSVEPSTSVPEPFVNESKVISEPKAVCKPKVWTDAPIIKEYESDSDDDLVFNVQEDKEKPSCAFTDSVKHVNTAWENIKEKGTPNHCPKTEKQDSHGYTRKGLGYAFNRKACFVCGSFSHLIRDCDFYENRMAKQAALTKSKNKFTMSNPHQELTSPEANGFCKEVASPKQTTLGKDISNSFMAVLIEAQQHISNESPLLGVNTPRCDEDSIKLKELMVLRTKLSNRVLALEQSKTAQDLVIKKLQKKVKIIERKIKVRTPGMTLFKIGNFKKESLDKENVSKHKRYLKTRLMFEESDFDNIYDMVDEDND